jgi:hypothetical protein
LAAFITNGHFNLLRGVLRLAPTNTKKGNDWVGQRQIIKEIKLRGSIEEEHRGSQKTICATAGN